MAWTKIPKPSAQSYTTVNPQGREQYDQASLYDDPNVFYEGLNPNQWTNVGKPGTILTWDLATFSWDSANRTWESPAWSNVAKPV